MSQYLKLGSCKVRAFGLKSLVDHQQSVKYKSIEQHIFDTNAGKTTVLSPQRCLINTGV